MQHGSRFHVAATQAHARIGAPISRTHTPSDLQSALADARTRGVVASAQQLLTDTKDETGFAPSAVTSLRIDTTIHARRVSQSVAPAIRFTADLAPGQRRLVNAGSPQIGWVTERLTTWNGVVVDRQTISHEVVRPAQRGLMLVGTPKTLAQFRAAFPGRAYATALTMIATAYTANSATAAPTGYTATGILARQGVVAVDPRVIPLGTRLFVPGYGIAIAADTGGAIVGDRIDLCMDSYGDAMMVGRQTVHVYIIKQ